MQIGLLYSRIREEEKLIIRELEKRNVDFELIDVRKVVFNLHEYEKWMNFDAVLNRSVSHSQSETVLDILNHWGIPCVNNITTARICGDKRITSQRLIRHNVPTPEVRIALSVESALEAIEEMGYPVVLKPTVGSWGRLLAKVNDRETAESILLHKSELGSYQHSIFYIQEYIEKGGFDIRTFVVGDETICGITRSSEHWITNTARSGRAANCPITPEIDQLSRAAARAVGGGIVAIDIMENRDGEYVVNEINHTMEFKNSIRPTGINIPGKIVDHVIRMAEQNFAPQENLDMLVPSYAG